MRYTLYPLPRFKFWSSHSSPAKANKKKIS